MLSASTAPPTSMEGPLPTTATLLPVNMDVGGAVAAEELLNGYDAVVLCCGAKKARDLNVPGRDANGVHFAVDYLTSVTRSLLDSQFADGKAIDAKGKVQPCRRAVP